MLRVGLTGGIGSGKSMVAGQLAKRGAWVIDSDQLARQVLGPGSAGLLAVVEVFGEEVLAEHGTLDRAALAKRVFDDERARSRLNAIVHPLVAARSAELIATAPPEAIVVHDVPLLIETGMAAGFPLVIVVHADTTVRLSRLVEQRGMASSDAAARIAAQTTDEQRRAAADVWLDNNGSPECTVMAVDQLWAQRLVPFEANLRRRCPGPRAPKPNLVAPDPSWPQQAQRVIARIAAEAGQRAYRIDHIGSTAVPGLDARDVLDVQVVVADLAAAAELADDLINAGLVKRAGCRWDTSREGINWDKAFAANADPGRAVDCHIRPADSAAWREAVLLRDWLRTHPAAVQDYARVKHRLVVQPWESIKAYADAKTPFVSSALARAEQWARRSGWRAP
jgi:dephospho-CoA kinase